jgi:hypothetical protein
MSGVQRMLVPSVQGSSLRICRVAVNRAAAIGHLERGRSAARNVVMVCRLGMLCGVKIRRVCVGGLVLRRSSSAIKFQVASGPFVHGQLAAASVALARATDK